MELIIPVEITKGAQSIAELDGLYFDYWKFNLKTKPFYQPKRSHSKNYLN